MSVKSKKSNPSDPSDQSLIGIYLLLAELLHKELNPQLRDILLQPEILGVLTSLEPACADYLSQPWTEADYEQAAVDFCATFIMPESDSAPRAAAWLPMGGELTAEAVDAMVNQFMKEWKVEVPPSYQRLASDHLSLILYLAVVIRQQDSDLADEFEAAVLAPWLAKFGASLSSSDSPVYRALGAILTQQH